MFALNMQCASLPNQHVAYLRFIAKYMYNYVNVVYEGTLLSCQALLGFMDGSYFRVSCRQWFRLLLLPDYGSLSE